MDEHLKELILAVEEDGDLVLAGSEPLEFSSLDGDQEGFYLQGVYQFRPQWRVGLRYDRLWSDNEGSDPEVLEEAGLLAEGDDPERSLERLVAALERWRDVEPPPIITDLPGATPRNLAIKAVAVVLNGAPVLSQPQSHRTMASNLQQLSRTVPIQQQSQGQSISSRQLSPSVPISRI